MTSFIQKLLSYATYTITFFRIVFSMITNVYKFTGLGVNATTQVIVVTIITTAWTALMR